MRAITSVPIPALIISTIALGVAFGFAAAQSPSTPFPNHEQPPSGWYCHPAQDANDVSTDAHACNCLGMIDDPICKTDAVDEEGNPTGEQVPLTNDTNRCKVFCHKDSCTCMRQCKST